MIYEIWVRWNLPHSVHSALLGTAWRQSCTLLHFARVPRFILDRQSMYTFEGRFFIALRVHFPIGLHSCTVQPDRQGVHFASMVKTPTVRWHKYSRAARIALLGVGDLGARVMVSGVGWVGEEGVYRHHECNGLTEVA